VTGFAVSHERFIAAEMKTAFHAREMWVFPIFSRGGGGLDCRGRDRILVGIVTS